MSREARNHANLLSALTGCPPEEHLPAESDTPDPVQLSALVRRFTP